MNRVSTYYSWAQMNTKPRIISNEKGKREKLNGFLSVDLITAKEHIEFKESSKTDDVAEYLHNLCVKSESEKYNKITIILDNNSSHKELMRYKLWHLNKSNAKTREIEVEFMYTPAYSPDFNVAEYVIHQIRLKLLHHSKAGSKVKELSEKVLKYIENQSLQTKEQIRNTINHILKLGELDVLL